MSVFKKVEGAVALLDGCPVECEVRTYNDRLYVATGFHFRLLDQLAPERFKDDLGRYWTVKTDEEGRQ
ncbi:hypothetical protein GOD68_18070 [Sinorhizobium medicae]|nr:hypothetical protein [Sinorhizobium medicae]